MADVEKHLLLTLDRHGVIEDSESYATSSGHDHKAVVSSIKSLQSYEMVTAEVHICPIVIPHPPSPSSSDNQPSHQPACEVTLARLHAGKKPL